MPLYFTSENVKAVILKRLFLLTASISLLLFPSPVVFSEPAFENHLPNLMFQAYVEYSEGGYANKRTVLQGDRVTFYIGNALDHFSAKVLRVTGPPGSEKHTQTMLELDGLRGNSPEFGCTPQNGCDWDPTFEITIPSNWPSGWYRLAFPVKYAEELRYVDFIVAERDKSAELLFIFDMQTAHAYNVYAGGSFYGSFDRSGTWVRQPSPTQLSFRRPLVRSHSFYTPRIVEPVWIPHEEESFRLWLEGNFSVAYISNDALERFGLQYLEQYPLIVIVGTQEYWSNRQVELIKNYVLGGGALYLSAIEFAYGAVRLEQDGEVMRYFLDPREDPIIRTAPEEVATVRAAVSDLEDFFGVSLEQGKGLGRGEEFSDLIVVNPESWVFEGLGYSEGDALAGVRGLGVGAWVKQGEDGRYCIVSAKIPCEKTEVLAIAPYPPLSDSKHVTRDRLIDGRVDHTVTILPDKTFAVVALIEQGKGKMFVGPGGWLNLPHPHNTDPRVRTMIKNVIQRLGGFSD